MNNTLTIEEVITHLQTCQRHVGNQKVYVTDERNIKFEGIGKVFVVGSGLTSDVHIALLKNSQDIPIK